MLQKNFSHGKSTCIFHKWIRRRWPSTLKLFPRPCRLLNPFMSAKTSGGQPDGRRREGDGPIPSVIPTPFYMDPQKCTRETDARKQKGSFGGVGIVLGVKDKMFDGRGGRLREHRLKPQAFLSGDQILRIDSLDTKRNGRWMKLWGKNPRNGGHRGHPVDSAIRTGSQRIIKLTRANHSVKKP